MPPPLDPDDAPPYGQYCDLVLQGGVVDGVIYPGVLIELARRFRFQSLAGTSVGAIAAALAAASEFSRRFGSNRGFDSVLREVPEKLAENSPNDPRHTVIRSLFQTEKPLHRLFNFLVDMVSVGLKQLLGTLPGALWKHYRLTVSLGFILGLMVALAPTVDGTELWQGHWPRTGFGGGQAAWQAVLSLLFGLFVALLALLLTWCTEVHQLVKAPGFGFCSGRSTDGGKTDGLIDWLHKGIQGACGLPLHRPLTFQDLWDAPLGPKSETGQPRQKSIDLRMMTSCVSHGRPYEMPLEDHSVRLFFNLKEWERYFPREVIAYLRINSTPYTEDAVEHLKGAPYVDSSGQKKRFADLAVSPSPDDPAITDDFREMPRGGLPILVAVRLSMNFPILFQAVPAYAIDHERWNSKKDQHPRFKQAWFTDGGVTSNFPLHIFDSPVPDWPTFGIYLTEDSRKDKLGPNGSQSDLPFKVTKDHGGGRSEKWKLIGEDDGSGSYRPQTWAGFLDYLLSVASTAKDWSDNANLRMPGIRDRVVTIYKKGQTSGGLNLKIESKAIRELAYGRGTQAGKALADKFSDSPPKFNQPLRGSAAWMDHRWVRFNAYLTALRTHLAGFANAAHQPFGSSSLPDQIERAMVEPALEHVEEYEAKLTKVQAQALQEALTAIANLEKEICTKPVLQPYMAKPQHELKAYPRL